MSLCVEREEGDRPESPASSCVSMKSDWSKEKRSDCTNEPRPPHTQIKRPDKPATDDDNWDCRRCFYRNTVEYLRCRSCDLMKIISTSLDSIKALPPSAADMKSWHKDITQERRDLYIRELVVWMSTGDPAEDIKNLVTDVQNIERNMYESVNSWEEYWKLMREKISALNEKQWMNMGTGGHHSGSIASIGSSYSGYDSTTSSGTTDSGYGSKSIEEPRVPDQILDSITALPLSAADTTKSWHKDIKQDWRDYYVCVLVAWMSTGDPAEDIKDLVTEAQNMERNRYVSADSYGDYNDLMEEKWSELEKSMEKDSDEHLNIKQPLVKWMQSISQRSTSPLPIGDKGTTHPQVVSETKLEEEKLSTLRQKGHLTASSSTAKGVKDSEIGDTLDQKKEKSRVMVCFGRLQEYMRVVTHSEMEDTPKETKELNEERDRRRVKQSEFTLFDPPFTHGDNPHIQSQSQPKIYPLEPGKHHSSTKTPSPYPNTSSDSTLNRPRMVSSQKTQDRKRRKEDLKEIDLPSSKLPPFPSSTLDELDESGIPSSQDALQEVITPNMHPSVVIVSPMLSSSFISQQSSHVSPEEMKAFDLSTSDQPLTESLSSVHPSLELQDETYLSLCFSGLKIEESIALPRSHSLPSQTHIPCLENKAGFREKRSHSVNDVTLLDKTQKITPDIIMVENKKCYRFHCTQAGLFQCSVTGLGFKMEAEGDVTYRTVPWDRSLLAQLVKRPAGPLFDIKGSQRSVCQLRFPHCEILSMGGGKSLYVVHMKDDGQIELIYPDVITETHVIINVNAFSPHGLVNDGESTKQALVSLFYTPPIDDDDDPISTLKVLLLPGNVVLSEVMNTRRKLFGEEIYIEKPPCDLTPNQEYTLSTSPADDSIIIEPDKAKFRVDESSYHNYISTFEVTLEVKLKRVGLHLRDTNISDCAWKGCVHLSTSALRRQQVQRTLNLPTEDRLFSVRSSFIDSVSDPVLNILLDKLLEKGVIIKDEYDEARAKPVKSEKARCVIDTVWSKGTAASSSLILFLFQSDPYLSEYLRLT